MKRTTYALVGAGIAVAAMVFPPEPFPPEDPAATATLAPEHGSPVIPDLPAASSAAPSSAASSAPPSPSHATAKPTGTAQPDAIGCTPVVLTDATPQTTIDALLFAHWMPKPTDHREALYPPGC